MPEFPLDLPARRAATYRAVMSTLHEALIEATPIPELRGVDRARFEREILPAAQPVVLRGLVAGWPAANLGGESPAAVCRFLIGLDNGTPVDAIMLAPEEKGRIFYNAAFDGFNFLRNKLPLARIIEQVARYSQFEHAPAVAAQSALIRTCLPGFTDAHAMPLLDAVVEPRIWLGTAITVPAHCDETDNIACVVAGRRRFTLFPPGQIANLYIGPLDFAPTGTPISLVDFAAPDFARFPKFREACAHALVAELGPGDAIFIPALWWHHVQSLQACNILVNYWWNGPARASDHRDCLLHALLTLRRLPATQRAAWAQIFQHYVFGDTDAAAAHIPAPRRGVLGELDAASRREQLRQLAQRLMAG